MGAEAAAVAACAPFQIHQLNDAVPGPVYGFCLGGESCQRVQPSVGNAAIGGPGADQSACRHVTSDAYYPVENLFGHGAKTRNAR